MKRPVDRKLPLRRDTVRTLQNDDLTKVAAGYEVSKPRSWTMICDPIPPVVLK
jgi:hypothetical protein